MQNTTRLVLVLAALLPAAASAAGAPRITLAHTGDLPQGEIAAIDVMVEDAPPVAGVQLSLVYDPSMIKVIDADPKTAGVQAVHGDFFDAEHFYTVRNDGDAKKGDFTYVVSELYPATQREGKGRLLTLRVTALKAGDSTITVKAAKFGDFNGKPWVADPGKPLTLHGISTGHSFLTMPPSNPATTRAALPLGWIAAGTCALLLVAGAFWLGRRSRRAA